MLYVLTLCLERKPHHKTLDLVLLYDKPIRSTLNYTNLQSSKITLLLFALQHLVECEEFVLSNPI